MMTTRRFTYYFAASVSLLTFAVYLADLRNEFIGWDDVTYVVENPHIRSLDPSFFKWAFFDFYASNWHPLTWISHALDYAIWGLNPLGHHLTNNILHALNTFLVVLLVVKLMEAVGSKQYAVSSRAKGSEKSVVNSKKEGEISDRPGTDGFSPLTTHYSLFTSHDSRFTLIIAGVTGLFFGLHPIHVESVAWVAERKDLLCALFYLLSIMAYVNYATLGQALGDNVMVGQSNSGKPYLLSVGFFILALLSKPMAVSLPLVLLLLDWYPFEKIRSLKTFLNSVINKLPFIALSIASSILTILAQEKAMSLNEIVPLPARVLVAVRSIIEYLGMMLFPLDLSPFYPYSGNVFLLSPAYFLPLFLLVGLTATCIVIAGKKQKIYLLLWGYYIVTLLPVLGIVQVGRQSMADRYTYLPSIGPFWVAGLFAAWIYRKVYTANPATGGRSYQISPPGQGLSAEPDNEQRGILLSTKWNTGIKVVCTLSALCLLTSLPYLTYRQIGIWNNTVEFWGYVILKDPKVPLAYYNRGVALYKKGQTDKAIEDYDKAIALDPSYPKAYMDRGFVFSKNGQPNKAIADFDRAIALDPRNPEAYNSRGAVFEKIGELDKAIADFDKAVALNPPDSEAYNNLGVIFEKAGKLDKAVANYDRAVALNPSNSDAYFNRGNALDEMGRFDKAIEDYNKAIALNPRDSGSFNNRGLVHEKTGNLDKAIADYDKAVALDPSNAEAYNNRLSALGKKSAGPVKQGHTATPLKEAVH